MDGPSRRERLGALASTSSSRPGHTARIRAATRCCTERRRRRRPAARQGARRRGARRRGRAVPRRRAQSTERCSSSTTVRISSRRAVPTASTSVAATCRSSRRGRSSGPIGCSGSRSRPSTSCGDVAGADYVGVTAFDTPTKEDAVAGGLELLRAAQPQRSTVPWFAIGGIDLSNVAEVVAAGAPGIAVVRAIRDADDPEAAARDAPRSARSAGVGRSRRGGGSARGRAGSRPASPAAPARRTSARSARRHPADRPVTGRGGSGRRAACRTRARAPSSSPSRTSTQAR